MRRVCLFPAHPNVVIHEESFYVLRENLMTSSFTSAEKDSSRMTPGVGDEETMAVTGVAP